MTMNIRQALATLDPENDTHWTADGLPLVDIVSALVGSPVKRQDITDAAPSLTRDTAAARMPDEAPAGDGLFGDEGGQPPLETVPQAPQAAAQPEAVPSVLQLSISTLMGDPALARQALTELEGRIAQAHATKREAEKALDGLNTLAAALSAFLDRLQRADPQAGTAEIRAYLNRGNEARAERTARARAFLNAGTTAKEDREQLEPRSKLDQAMARKNTRGAQRPPPRLLTNPARS
jgi:hypothetical protein